MKNKVFCIGANKTGTTSMEQLLKDFGFKVGNQKVATCLFYDWAKRDFKSIIKYCESAEAFQDIPFSLPFTYQAVDAAYPNSKFILLESDSAEKWFDTTVIFQSNWCWSFPPTVADLKLIRDNPVVDFWTVCKLVYGLDEEGTLLYNKEHYIRFYETYNRTVKEYFSSRPDDLLTINVGDENVVQELCEFLEIENKNYTMPHLNKD
jgi:hypothetical protein